MRSSKKTNLLNQHNLTDHFAKNNLNVYLAGSQIILKLKLHIFLKTAFTVIWPDAKSKSHFKIKKQCRES